MTPARRCPPHVWTLVERAGWCLRYTCACGARKTTGLKGDLFVYEAAGGWKERDR